jgi:dTDP-4-dehydrorhamnose 3,5-epimerase
MITVTDLIGGAKLIHNTVYHDARGNFCEIWKTDWNSHIGIEFDPKQINIAFSTNTNTFRGLHAQHGPGAVAKLVRVVSGSVIDIIVDAQANSPTQGQWQAIPLISNADSIYIPAGLYHGYVSLEENTLINYVMDCTYMPEYECGLSYKSAPENFWSTFDLDPAKFIISDRDLEHPAWAQAIKF